MFFILSFLLKVLYQKIIKALNKLNYFRILLFFFRAPEYRVENLYRFCYSYYNFNIFIKKFMILNLIIINIIIFKKAFGQNGMLINFIKYI